MKGTFTHLRASFPSTALPVESVLSPKSSGNSVLVVDDDNAVCRIVQRMLSDEKYQVQTSQSVADAFRAIEQKPFDAYVMDDKLPDGSGLDVAERIRSGVVASIKDSRSAQTFEQHSRRKRRAK